MQNTSRIESIISEIENYIDGCKASFMNKSFIMVNRDDIETLLRDLRNATPEEIKRYQKIITNKDAILADAKSKAEALVDEATEKTNALLSEHQIMLEAHARADEIIRQSTERAQEILDSATIQANAVKDMATQYMDDVLAHLETIISSSTEAAVNNYNGLIGNLNHYKDIIESNRKELHPQEEEMEVVRTPIGAGEENEEE